MTMLPNAAHAEAQSLSIEAERRARAGEAIEARSLYGSAARLELAAFKAVPSDQVRTRGILAVSASSLHYKARDLTEAERVTNDFRANESLPAFAREQLAQVLEAIWHAQWLMSIGRELSQETVVVSLRGRDVGTGQAPLSLVVDKINGINSLLFRITELLGGFSFRTKGPPNDEVRALCQPIVGEPTPGSYRFSIRLAQSLQPRLFDNRRVEPQAISGKLLEVVSIVSPSYMSVVPSRRIQESIPDAQYRDVMLKLVRNLTPDGTRLREIELTTSTGGNTSSAVLHSGARPRIDEVIQASQPRRRSATIVGTLRALNLDETFLEVVQESGQRTKCRTKGEVLDDVIGPMVNKKVIVTGQWTPSGKIFNLIDVELDPEAEKSSQ